MTSVVVIDYGLGNIHSVVKALDHLGARVEVTQDPATVARAERVVLPGVGAFADGMRGLRDRGLLEGIHQFVTTGRPLLGICLGMQLLLGESEEFGTHAGLAVIPGKVALIPRAPGRKVPHTGWNRVVPAGSDWAGTPLESVPAGAMMYFVHSYSAVPDDPAHRLADADYAGYPVCAAVRKDNVSGTQFHPEKSGPTGLLVLAHHLR